MRTSASISRGSRLALAGAFAAAAVTGSMGSALAATAAVHNDPAKLAQTPSIANTRTPALYSTVSKAAGMRVVPLVTGSGSVISGSHTEAITPPNGSTANIYTWFDTNYSWKGCGIASCSMTLTNGSSEAEWLGSNPYNADAITLTDGLWCGEVGGISVSIGSSPSAGVSVTSEGVNFSSTVNNNWRNLHSWDNITFKDYTAMWGPYENATTAFSFSYQTFYDDIS